jgi:hypothetical protein
MASVIGTKLFYKYSAVREWWKFPKKLMPIFWLKLVGKIALSLKTMPK